MAPMLMLEVASATVNALTGAFVLMPTPPAARTRNWLFAVLANSASVESPHTKAPAWLAMVR